MKLFLLPIGSWEPHPGLEEDLDTRIAAKIAEILSERVGGNVLPPIPFSASFEWEESISLKVETLSAVLRDVNESIKKLGGALVVVNAHGGNSGLLQAIARQEGFYVIDFYGSCGIKVGHSALTECLVAKVLGVIDTICEKGKEWPRRKVEGARIKVGRYDEEGYSFYEIQIKIMRCLEEITKELKGLEP
ncbi:hypothetical protein IPA_07230 [Ignicoccus pacificus DSM 13166]|uniref:Creatinine amidohydrolase n=1 Tax=Ignicoccus pacificus DSM 13166 TaxID=940294 RepID=A0A977KBP2_9CREN|nr:hypothetical protein IPA_07230 [Ignicoccus pacificus DSM 13166]